MHCTGYKLAIGKHKVRFQSKLIKHKNARDTNNEKQINIIIIYNNKVDKKSMLVIPDIAKGQSLLFCSQSIKSILASLQESNHDPL